MSCQDAQKLLEPYLDGELDASNSLELERHLKTCADCQALQARFESLAKAIRQPGVTWQTPAGLADRIHPTKSVQQPALWRWAAIAAGAAGLFLAGAAADHFLQQPTAPQTLLTQEIAASHVRSLMANHMADVISTDQHTVKPWFNGKLDFTPSVKDLAAQGFPLTGGRLDYLANHPVAALLYKRNQHPINLFEWPAANDSLAPETSTIRGYNIVHWQQAGMAYWAISDLNARELNEFAAELRR